MMSEKEIIALGVFLIFYIVGIIVGIIGCTFGGSYDPYSSEIQAQEWWPELYPDLPKEDGKR
jgi:hypothetical protein